ncbi:hypothetical protein Btru_043601 [Bulinus truncatus]|nr:hypothetical protein Btru_043601 [Bulinus truncatus]
MDRVCINGLALLLCTALPFFLCQSAVAQKQGGSSSEVGVKWGVADCTATVGRLFRMHVPGDAFSGDVISLHGEVSTRIVGQDLSPVFIDSM